MIIFCYCYLASIQTNLVKRRRELSRAGFRINQNLISAGVHHERVGHKHQRTSPTQCRTGRYRDFVMLLMTGEVLRFEEASTVARATGGLRKAP
jgi:hypothetical protein